MMEGFNKHVGVALLTVLAVMLFPVSALIVSGADMEYSFDSPKVFSSEMFPCSACHAGMKADSTRRTLAYHTEIQLKGHGETRMWCFGCHNAGDRDKLKLAGGEKVDFMELHRLCGQCHENIYKHWRAGIHGKRTGYWDGPKRYFLCTFCHNPHSPRFKPLAPKPVPLRPTETLRGRK